MTSSQEQSPGERGKGDSDSTDVVYSFPKNASQVVCGSLSYYKEERWFDIRIYVPVVDEDGGFIRTRKGVFLRIGELRALKAHVGHLQDAISLNQVAGSIKKSAREEVRVGLQEYRGVPMAYVRIFALVGQDEWTPTQKGVSINVSMRADLISLLDGLEAEAVTRGWLPAE